MFDLLVEIFEEFRSVLGEKLLDAILPPIVFLLGNHFLGLLGGGLIAGFFSILILLIRRSKGHSLLYATFGVLGVVLALGLALFLENTQGFFLPDIFFGGLTIFLILFSLIIGRPFTAWTSFLSRRWPLDWYWHSKVRPAYIETTLVWLIFFLIRFVTQLHFFQNSNESLSAWIQVLMGWPALIILLVFTYIYGSWRLRKLFGPSVEEFLSQMEAPWSGQKKGF